MDNLKIPSKSVNNKDLWQTFIMLHNLQGKEQTESIFQGFKTWKETLQSKNLIFQGFEFMGISPNNGSHNHY